VLRTPSNIRILQVVQMRCRKVPGGQVPGTPLAHWMVQLRKDPDVVARVLEEFDPSGTQDRARWSWVGLF
jgi:hypothetical protein